MTGSKFVQIDGWVLNLAAVAWFEVKGLGDRAALTIRCFDGSEHTFSGERAAAAARKLVEACNPERWELPAAKPPAPAPAEPLPPGGPEALEWAEVAARPSSRSLRAGG